MTVRSVKCSYTFSIKYFTDMSRGEFIDKLYICWFSGIGGITNVKMKASVFRRWLVMIVSYII